MIVFLVNFEIFRTKLIVESQTGYIYVKVTRDNDNGATYEFYTMSHGALAKAVKKIVGVNDCLAFEDRYLKNTKIIIVEDVLQRDKLVIPKDPVTFDPPTHMDIAATVDPASKKVEEDINKHIQDEVNKFKRGELDGDS